MFLNRYLNWLFSSHPLLTHHLIWLPRSHPHHAPSIGSEASEAQKLTPTEDNTAVVPVISQDVIYEIVDHLVTDAYFKPTLLSCSLISKSWITPCQRYLFQTLSFSLRDTFRWLEVFPVPEQSPAHHVKYLSLSLEGSYFVPDEFFERIQLFINLKEIVLLGEGSQGQSWWIPSSAMLPQSVTSLTIIRGNLSLSEIRNVMAQLPNLNDLTLSVSFRTRNGLQGFGRNLKGKFGGRLQLHRLRMGPDADIANMLLEIPTGLHFTEIVIEGTSWCLLSTVKLAQVCSKTLVKLSYTVDNYGSFEAPRRSFDFAQLPNLKEMNFAVKWLTGDLLWIPTALSTIKPVTSPHLSSIRLSFSGRDLQEIPPHPRERLINELTVIGEDAARIEREFAGILDLTVVWYPGFEH
ncbi:hypothetical protein BJ322DRAFT_249939 [Thelephora terrestris]|uniref:Uncharacterized protein n=1 Tax=Thelephora terrestris TaxID=56493 RepID=A0A9P6HA94_9AGAM|nr:hypothetical protein BJ322DRAFT_249939 [Thelephora terrestris]